MCKFTDGVWCLYVTLLVSSPARSPALEIIISLYFLVIMKVAARLSGLRMNVRESQYRSVINRGIRTNRKKLMDISMTTVKMACVMRWVHNVGMPGRYHPSFVHYMYKYWLRLTIPLESLMYLTLPHSMMEKIIKPAAKRTLPMDMPTKAELKHPKLQCKAIFITVEWRLWNFPCDLVDFKGFKIRLRTWPIPAPASLCSWFLLRSFNKKRATLH